MALLCALRRPRALGQQVNNWHQRFCRATQVQHVEQLLGNLLVRPGPLLQNLKLAKRAPIAE
eukprot:9508153-Alexandrium_andersonii.AAC.1